MEEQALYRAILAAPHDDAARLVYADWLDENAEALPPAAARLDRARAELIRVQCRLTRLTAAGWKAPPPVGPFAPDPDWPALVRREKRLRFLYSGKWRRGLPGQLAGHPFDRGFFRPFLALRPHEFLHDPGAAPGRDSGAPPPLYDPLPRVPEDHFIARYAPPGERFAAFPLWDVHLYAWADSPYTHDPCPDRGDYGELLARVARSPGLARAGWLKVSFSRTPVVDFLRDGNFANVETLVLNSGPFPAVLEAVADNESFRSLRYIQFGEDDWAWITTYPLALQYAALAGKIRAANERHLPFGEMRGALRAILRDTPVIVPAPTPAPAPEPPRTPTPTPAWAPAPSPGDQSSIALRGLVLIGILSGIIFNLFEAGRRAQESPAARPPALPFQYNPDLYKVPQGALDAEKLLRTTKPAPVRTKMPAPKGQPEVEELPPGFVGPPRPKRAEPTP